MASTSFISLSIMKALNGTTETEKSVSSLEPGCEDAVAIIVRRYTSEEDTLSLPVKETQPAPLSSSVRPWVFDVHHGLALAYGDSNELH
ncbi:hypothetical protein J4Q44_G00152840 [Coregonus suidteri]|uniref:Uncharacterized protein n=1 Tax=Coregonus suidteri TaxID=861788 RepID=A0AAN8LWV9_9TELE